MSLVDVRRVSSTGILEIAASAEIRRASDASQLDRTFQLRVLTDDMDPLR